MLIAEFAVSWAQELRVRGLLVSSTSGTDIDPRAVSHRVRTEAPRLLQVCNPFDCYG